MLCSMSNTFCSMSTMFLCIWQTLTVTNLTDCLASITPCCLVTTPMETKVFMWRFSDVCPGIVWRACTACTHPHDDCTAHIMFCAAKPIHVCCKPPSVLQSTLRAAKHPLCCKAPGAAKQPLCCKAPHTMCCKGIVCAAKQQTLTLLLFLLMLHGMFNAAKTVIYCSYLPGYVGCIYDDDNGKMSRTLDCDVWKLFVTWKWLPGCVGCIYDHDLDYLSLHQT